MPPSRSCCRPRLRWSKRRSRPAVRCSCPNRSQTKTTPRNRMAEPRSTWARVLDALAPYLLTLAIALPFAIYFTLNLRGADIHWRHRSALLLLSAVPLAAWVGFHLERRRAGTLVFTRTQD